MGDLSTNFSRREFACKDGCGLDTVDFETLFVLEQLRMYYNQPVIVHSAHRCPTHNKRVGGAPNSLHLVGRAVDFSIPGVPLRAIHQRLSSLMPMRGGIGLYKTFIHVDTRTNGPSRWSG